jgi:DNA-binding CsgD family transcriptional regulator
MGFSVSTHEMSVVRRLLLAEPDNDALLPSSAIEALTQLIGCDGFGVVEADNRGYLLRSQDFPRDWFDGDPQICDSSLPTGIHHLAFLRHRNGDDHVFSGDTLWSGFGVGGGVVRQVYFDRVRRSEGFGEREVALLTMVEPALGRLLRAAPEVDVGALLTPAEHRVLTLVAQGASNQEAAECLFVTVATVRKHLEHAYRKLGVTNRTAAAMAIRSSA